jgi:hypothetical protein
MPHINLTRACDRGSSLVAEPAIDCTAPSARTFLPAMADESLVIDARAGLTPSQLVEAKLLDVLRGMSSPLRLAARRSMTRR